MKKYIVTLLLLVMCGAASQFAKAEQVTYTYDSAGRLLRASYASGIAIFYTYDAAGNLLNRIVGSNATTYLVGDAFPAGADIVGGFGDGVLNNLDLIYALRAVTNVPGFAPAACTDRFDAMDPFPLDTPGVRGGDGVLNNLDLVRTLRRITNIDTTRPTRTARGITPCPKPPPAVATKSLREQEISDAVPAIGALEFGDAESTPDGVRVPIYLSATSDIALSSLSFSLGFDGSTAPLQFQAGEASAPALVDTGVPGALAVAWLESSLRLPARTQLLIGIVTMPETSDASADPLRIYGLDATGQDGASVKLTFSNTAHSQSGQQ